MRLALALASLLPLAPLAAAQETATYRVTLASTWSAETHPQDFPPNPHYSPLVAVAHAPGARIWEAGALASAGIEEMAETGRTALLEGEAAALVAAGQGAEAVVGPFLAVSPGVAEMTVEVPAAFPAVTLVTMLAPSPDWFVGVSALVLRLGGFWVSERAVPLYALDAGTDSGTTYTAPDEDTHPPEPIRLLDEPPFLVGGEVPPVGTLTFTLLGTTAAEAAPEAAALALDPPAPNPARHRATFVLRLDRPQAVRVEAFDVLGRRVAVLHDGPLAVGTHPLTLDVRALPSGVYVVRAAGARGTATRRLTVPRQGSKVNTR